MNKVLAVLISVVAAVIIVGVGFWLWQQSTKLTVEGITKINSDGSIFLIKCCKDTENPYGFNIFESGQFELQDYSEWQCLKITYQEKEIKDCDIKCVQPPCPECIIHKGMIIKDIKKKETKDCNPSLNCDC